MTEILGLYKTLQLPLAADFWFKIVSNKITDRDLNDPLVCNLAISRYHLFHDKVTNIPSDPPTRWLGRERLRDLLLTNQRRSIKSKSFN